jgi:hypothetical protein
MILLAFLGLMGFAVGMVSMPQESVLENSGVALQVGGGLLAGVYFLRLLFSAFTESLLQGLICLVLPPLYIATRWDRVAGIVIYLAIGAALVGLGIGLLQLAPLFKGDKETASQLLSVLLRVPIV